jgi:hypothetical protein
MPIAAFSNAGLAPSISSSSSDSSFSSVFQVLEIMNLQMATKYHLKIPAGTK